MRQKTFVLALILALCFFAMQCGQSSGPASPDMPPIAQGSDANLTGSVTAGGANSPDFSQITISVKGTSLQTQPDRQGYFSLANLPTGNLTVEVNVRNTVSDLALEQVQAREEIKAQIQINENDAARWSHMERHRRAEADLQFEIRPHKWNVDWENNPDDDLVSFKIYGEDVNLIDPESVVIKSLCSGRMIEWPDYTWELGGVYLKIFITKQVAIGLVDDPERGETCDFELTCSVDSEQVSEPITLQSYRISIVGPKRGDDLTAFDVKISPKKWNTSWTNSNGQVTIQVRGGDFDKIISDTFSLTFEANTLTYEKFQFAVRGSMFSAKLSKQDALTLIDNPVPGTEYNIQIEAEVDGGVPLSETVPIEIIGKKE